MKNQKSIHPLNNKYEAYSDVSTVVDKDRAWKIKSYFGSTIIQSRKSDIIRRKIEKRLQRKDTWSKTPFKRYNKYIALIWLPNLVLVTVFMNVGFFAFYNY